jgi:hypothetical protein
MSAPRARRVRVAGPTRLAAFTLLTGFGLGVLGLALSACGRDEGAGRGEREARGSASAGADGAPVPGSDSTGTKAAGGSGAAGRREIEQVRMARAALAHARIPLYPGSEGLDATEFEANTIPFVAVDFFSLDPPERVVAFYDENLRALTQQRNTTREPGAVRYEFESPFSGLAVRPWQPTGTDSLALVTRFDRRDAQGVTSEELDAYGHFLSKARTHVVVNVPRPEPKGSAS